MKDLRSLKNFNNLDASCKSCTNLTQDDVIELKKYIVNNLGSLQIDINIYEFQLNFVNDEMSINVCYEDCENDIFNIEFDSYLYNKYEGYETIYLNR